MKTKELLIIIAIMLLTSCISTKETTYFVGANGTYDVVIAKSQEPIIKCNDLLRITINADDPLAVAPFNSMSIKKNMNDIEILNQSETIENETLPLQTFLIDHDGYVTLPILGNIKIAGLKRTEATEKIKKALTPYIKNPVVTIQYVNFKVTILGEVNKPGVYTTNDDQINILEALGMAGDITIYGKRKNVLLIRDKESGKKDFIRIDMTKTDIFSSPYFYLQSGDILYVEPKTHKRNK